MPKHDILAIGASAGGVEALQALVCRLPLDLPAVVVVRTYPRTRRTQCRSSPGGYIAAPYHHLLAERMDSDVREQLRREARERESEAERVNEVLRGL